MTEQFAYDFLKLYPSANILVTTKKDFEAKSRKRLCARISTGDYDAVIIGHSQLQKIPISKERHQRLLNEQINEITQAIKELKSLNGEYFSIKQLEKTKKNLKTQLEQLTDDSRKDDVVTFEQLGVDRIFIDEADSFKNLFLYTKMRNVSGLSQLAAQKSSDLFMKCRYIDELTSSKGVIFATGTPISNSISELYTMQRYLQYETLKENDLLHFDAWASTFAETVTDMELAPEGTGYRAKTRFSKFYNLPELMSMFKEVADIKTIDMMPEIVRPKDNYATIVAKPSEIQIEMVKELSKRAEKIHKGNIDPKKDNMLKITTDGRKIGLDQRLINPLLPDFEDSKVNACIQNVYKIWEKNIDRKLTQIIFSDFSTPNKEGRFNIYDDIKEKLLYRGFFKFESYLNKKGINLSEIKDYISAGMPNDKWKELLKKHLTKSGFNYMLKKCVPKHEIAFIHDANTEIQKKELFEKVRQGKVRVLLGSTEKLGAGTNVQDLLITTHDIDCPWRPRDLEQRAGRIVRQGNINEEVYIYRYVTESTFDAYLYQTLEKKQEFIGQIMSSKLPVRSCEDVDESALSYAEIKALCTGNPLIKEKMDLDIDVSRLKLLHADYQNQKYRLEDNIVKHFPEEINKIKANITRFQNDVEKLKLYTETPKEGILPMIVNGTTYTKRMEAGESILDACKKITTSNPTKIGTYRGFNMYLEFNTFSKVYQMTLKGEMSYKAELGQDISGNITRINNCLNEIPKRLDLAKRQLENIQNQLENSKEEFKKPFAYENELTTKLEHLAFLENELNIDASKENAIVNEEENSKEAEIVTEKTVKPSVLEKLNQKKQEINNQTKKDVINKSVDISR